MADLLDVMEMLQFGFTSADVAAGRVSPDEANKVFDRVEEQEQREQSEKAPAAPAPRH